jgi:putative membrane protein
MQLAVFVIVALLLSWRPIGMRLVPAALKNRHARRLAREQFHALRLHETKAGTGILIFVSIAERYVEILADHGIHARVPDGTWANIVADFTAKVRAGRIVDGFISAIAACSAQLAEHFPRVADDRDELSDAVVEV